MGARLIRRKSIRTRSFEEISGRRLAGARTGLLYPRIAGEQWSSILPPSAMSSFQTCCILLSSKSSIFCIMLPCHGLFKLPKQLLSFRAPPTPAKRLRWQELPMARPGHFSRWVEPRRSRICDRIPHRNSRFQSRLKLHSSNHPSPQPP